MEPLTASQTMPMTVVAVIPAWNEEGNIGRVVAGIPRVVCPYVVVVDNASSDHTVEVAEGAGALVVEQPRRGYGYACAAGVAKAYELGAGVVVFLDGDFSDYPEEMPAVVGPILRGEADLVIGSRNLGGMERGALPGHAVMGNRLITLIMRLRFGVKISDLGPFHAIRTGTLQSLGMSEMTYGWTVEMVVKAARKGCRISEVPVRYHKRLSGQSKVSGNAAASVKAGWRILSVTLRHLI